MSFLKYLFSEFLLYICNYIVAYVPSHTVRLFFYRRFMNFRIGEKSYIFMGCSFIARNGFEMGNNSVINKDCRIDTRGGVKIGRNVSISENVFLFTADHDPQRKDFKGRNEEIVIEDYVYRFIGYGSTW